MVFNKMKVCPMGLEPTTFCFGGKYAIQLRYGHMHVL